MVGLSEFRSDHAEGDPFDLYVSGTCSPEIVDPLQDVTPRFERFVDCEIGVDIVEVELSAQVGGCSDPVDCLIVARSGLPRHDVGDLVDEAHGLAPMVAKIAVMS